MKPQAQKAAFIQVRAGGKSDAAISKALTLSEDVRSQREQERKDEIAGSKREPVNELHSACYMRRKAPIKKPDALEAIVGGR